MKQFITFTTFLLLLFSIQLNAQDSVASCTRKITVTKTNECTVEITLKNITPKGFAKVTEDIPSGYTAEVIDAGSSVFSFNDNTVKFIYVNFPQSNEIKLSYKIKGDRIETIKIKGTFVYLKDLQKETITIKNTNAEPEKKQKKKEVPPAVSGGTLITNSEILTYNDVSSLLDNGIGQIVKKNGGLTDSDIQGLILSNGDRIIIVGYGYSYTDLYGFLSSGARIMLDRTMSTFDIKQLVQLGGEKVIINGNGFDNFDLENYLSFGACVVLTRNQWGMAQTWVEKYGNKIILSNNSFTLFEISGYMKQGAGVWISSDNPISYDVRSYLELSASYGGTVYLDGKLSKMDILTLTR